MSVDYNKIAYFYDYLKWFVFGNKLERAEKYFAHHIRGDSTVLILGGGSGKIVSSLPETCKVTYVELSSRMIDLTKNRSYEHAIEFIQQDAVNYLGDTEMIQADVIITSFFLDQFTEDKIRDIALCIKEKSTIDLHWYVTDFQLPKAKAIKGKFRKHLLVKLMYLFFRLTTGLSVQKLPEIRKTIESGGFKEAEYFDTRDGFIFSSVYQL